MASAAAASFRIGQKELFLPSFHISLLRTPTLPPHQARFHVPLWFSKLDLRDYLYHAYNVEILSVRSYVNQQRVQQQRENSKRPTPRRWYRPQAKKFMTVQLVRPFVWPAEPENYKEWNREEVEKSEETREEFGERIGLKADTVVDVGRREAMREQAERLLRGEERWVASPYRGMTAGVLRR